MGAGEVAGMNEPLPLDISKWPIGVSAQLGCRCRVSTVPIAQLADDVRQSGTTRKTIRRTIRVE